MNYNDIDWKELFKKQDELDQFIYETKNIQNPEKLLPEKNIALNVEWNELINTLPRIFKYWSVKENDMVHAIEEYADNIFFMLSIGKLLGISDYKYKRPTKEYDLRILVLGINNMISSLSVTKQWERLMNHMLLFAEKCNFTEEMILKAYNEKYEENIRRQQNGY